MKDLDIAIIGATGALAAAGGLSTVGTLPAALAAGSLVTFALLGIAHTALWPWRNHIPRPASYTIGMACIGAGLLIISAITQAWIITIAFVSVVLPGGLLIIAAWWLRSALGLPADRLSDRSEGSRGASRESDHRNN